MTGLRWSGWGFVLSVLLFASACSKGQSEQKCQADTDCKNGTLCEGEMCIPDAVAKKARAFETQKVEEKKDAAKKDTAEDAEEEDEKDAEEGGVPLIPLKTSDPPKLEDWQNAAEVNTQHVNGIAKECSMKVVREWVRVFCRGETLGYQDLTEFGKDKVDYYVSVKESSLSFVGRIKQGPKQSLRICRRDDRASLAVYWPHGKDRPEHIALGDGGPCENQEYEESPQRKEGESDGTEDETNRPDGGKPVPKRPKKPSRQISTKGLLGQ